MRIKDIIKIVLFIGAMTIYCLVELDFQEKYKKNREQQKIEHEFYDKHKCGEKSIQVLIPNTEDDKHR